MVFLKKVLSRWFDTIGQKNFWGGPMIDTIDQKWTIVNRWIDTIGSDPSIV